MKNRILIILAFVGLTAFFTACEEDGERITMSENPVPPALVTFPDLTLERNNASDTLVFVGTPVDPGFVASANYYLEACPSGDNFENTIQLYSGIQDTLIKFVESELNSVLLDAFPADVASSVDFRIRATLVVDAGTGSLGTGDNPLEYASEAYTQSVMLYGLPRLDLIDSGMEQKIQSEKGDGVYKGIVKLSPASPFTLYDPDAAVSYGGSDGTLVADGAAIVSDQDGWSMLSADLNTLTYTIEQHSMGLIGSAVPPYDWSEDIDMDWDAENKMWTITQDLVVGALKFRRNDGWAWNMGFVEGTADPGLSGPTQQGGVGNDIPITEDGNYTCTLTVYSDDAGFYEIIKND